MRPYVEMLRARFLALLQYRAAALAGLATQIFWGFLRVMIFAAFYRSTDLPQPMTMEELVTYIWLGQATLMLVIWRADPEIEAMVRTGNVAYELLRPVDLYALWFARSIASRAAPTLLRCIPMFALAMLFFGMKLPASPAAGLAWLAATAFALLLSAAIGAIMMITLLWTISGRGVNILLWTCGWTLSGILIPIPFFPDWLQPVLEALPFRGLMDVPFRLYIGHIPPSEALGVLAHQLAWIVLLCGFGRWLLSRGARRLVVQGG